MKLNGPMDVMPLYCSRNHVKLILLHVCNIIMGSHTCVLRVAIASVWRLELCLVIKKGWINVHHLLV